MCSAARYGSEVICIHSIQELRSQICVNQFYQRECDALALIKRDLEFSVLVI